MAPPVTYGHQGMSATTSGTQANTVPLRRWLDTILHEHSNKYQGFFHEALPSDGDVTNDFFIFELELLDQFLAQPGRGQLYNFLRDLSSDRFGQPFRDRFKETWGELVYNSQTGLVSHEWMLSHLHWRVVHFNSNNLTSEDQRQQITEKMRNYASYANNITGAIGLTMSPFEHFAAAVWAERHSPGISGWLPGTGAVPHLR